MKAYSHTARQEYLTCPRKFYLSRQLRLERGGTSAGLRVGRVWATALEEPNAIASSRVIADAQRNGDITDVEQAQLTVLAIAYWERYGQRFPSGQVYREVAFDDPILGKGRLDALVKVGAPGVGGTSGAYAYRWEGVEDKLLTPGFWRAADEKRLRIDPQVTAYFAAMREAGTPMAKLHYRVTFKPSIKPDSRKGESLPDYMNRLMDRIDKDPTYAFREYELYRTDAQMDEFLDRAGRIHQMIAQSKRAEMKYGENAWPANMGSACTQFGECEFLDLCTGQTSGYRVKADPLTEREALLLSEMGRHPVKGIGLYVDGVASVLKVSVPTARRVVKRLVEAGYVERTVGRPMAASRRHLFEITPAGEAAIK
jgi:DNA-binding MarR family transcriptional regulator